jgi:competence protein ComEA
MDEHSKPPRRFVLLRRADQACVAALVLASVGSIVFFWLWHGGQRGKLIEIDRAAPAEITFQVDVNRAEWPELTLLPGVGESLARRIVEARERHGKFVSHEDLRRVKGIGPRTLDRLRPYLQPISRADSIAGP